MSHLRWSGSLKTMSPSAARSSAPSGVSIRSAPKCETSARKPLVPGSTTCRASRSASMRGREYGAEVRSEETVDLPEAIPPVRPMTGVSYAWGIRHGAAH